MSTLVDLLSWRSDPSILLRAQSEFLNEQAERLAILSARLEETDSALAAQMRDLLSINEAKGVFRVLLAPEVTARIRPDTHSTTVETGVFVVDSFRTEAAAAGIDGMRVSQPTWTALGDRLVLPSGEVVTPADVQCYPPIDAAGPQARSMDPVSGLCDVSIRRPPLESPNLRVVTDRLSDVQWQIERTSPLANALIRGCGVSLVLVEDPGTKLSSSTHGRYVGRITIACGSWQLVGAEAVADALVHEAIHCLLLMLDYRQPLLRDDRAADALPPVVSPWTGKSLPVPTYLHACFVWFGLAHFWQHAIRAGTFRSSECERLRDRARQGFLLGSVLNRLGVEGLALTNEDAKSSISLMEHRMNPTLQLQ